MFSEEQIERIVNKQLERISDKNLGVARTQLKDATILENFALIISGVRRSGKSTLLLQMLQKENKKTLFLNFEDPRLAGFEQNDFIRLGNIIERKKVDLLFFDEIQILDNWEMFVRQMLDDGYHVVITGSNASLLSREMGTKLTGRHLSYELFPFAYNEFLLLKKLKNSTKSLEKYLEQGGFPEYLKTENGRIINHLLSDILHRDIAVRFGVRDVTSLKKVAIYLISNIGKPVSANNLRKVLEIKATSTMIAFFSYLEDAYVVQFLPRFSYSVKKQIRNPRKVYAIDLGLFTHNSIVFSDELGRRLENMIYLHLRVKFEELYYFQEEKECDFVIMDRGKVVELIQVCYELNFDSLDREINGLLEAMRFFNIKKGTIVTFKQSDYFSFNEGEINVMPANEFMLRED